MERPELKFLIVDDFSTMRRIVRNLLKEIGYVNADEAEDGVVALTKLRGAHFDFVVSDLNMPNMSIDGPGGGSRAGRRRARPGRASGAGDLLRRMTDLAGHTRV